MRRKEENRFSIFRSTFFSGKRKVGLDTNILIKLYEQPDLFSYEQARIFNQQDIIFTSKICVWELTKHLMKTKNLTEEEARVKSKEFLKAHNINAIYVHIPKEEADGFEAKTNKRFQSENKPNLKCHKPDSIILLVFKKFGINKVISDDYPFRESAKHLGIDSERLPSLDQKISSELRKLFGRGKKKFRR